MAREYYSMPDDSKINSFVIIGNTTKREVEHVW